MAADPFANYIQIKKLYLLFQDSSRADIISLQLNYNVDQLPIVRVIVSRGPKGVPTTDNLSTTDTAKGSGGSRCTVCVALTNKNGTQTFNLFSGYIRAITPEMVATPQGVRYHTSYIIVAEPALLDMAVPGSYTYLHAGNNNTLARSPFNIIAAAFVRNAQEQTKAMQRFNTSPSECVATLIGSCLERLGDNPQAVTLMDCITHANGKPVRQIESGSIYGEKLFTAVTTGLQGSTPLQVFLQFCHMYFLNGVPETVADGDSPSKLIIRPVCGWDKDVTYTIKPEEILSVNGMTVYSPNNTTDCWGVCFSGSAGAVVPGFVAIYGPGYDKGKGEPVVFKEAELADKMPKIQNKDQRFTSVQIINLPAWLIELPQATAKVQADKGNKTGAKKNPVSSQTTEKQNELWAKRLAVLSFLQNGRATTGLSISVPFIVLCRLLSKLGDTICIEQPDPVDTLSKNTKKNAYYGMLSGLALSIQMNGQQIAVSAQATMTHVHNAEEQKKFAAKNPFYDLDYESREASQPGAYELENFCS